MKQPGPEQPPAASLRLDKWLWFARFARTRSLAAKLCADGRVRIGKSVVLKPGHTVRIGDRIEIEQGRARRIVLVLSLGERRGNPTEARILYHEPEPPVPLPSYDPSAWTPLIEDEEAWA